MTVYIAKRNISFQDGRPMIRRGSLVLPGEVKRVEDLKRRGALVEVTIEDNLLLAAVPGWSSRSKKLGALGYDTVMDALAVDTAALAAAVDRQPETVERWKQELRRYLEHFLAAEGC